MLVESSVDAPAMSPEGCTSPQPSDGEEGKGRVFACTMCSYRTDRKNNLKRHTLTMHELSPALLECCGLRFLNKAELRMHTHKFHRDGYHCDVCGRVFCRKALLKRHYSVHSGFKEFSCHFCGYETSHKSNLERHMRVHRKDGAPLPQHLLEGGFLPELSQPSGTFSPAMNFRSSLLPAQPRPVLPLFPEHHPHLYSTPGAPAPAWPAWPVLTPPTPPAPSVPALPQHLLQKAQPVTSHPEGQTTDFLPEAVTPKKQGPRRGFSVSALLGDDLRPDDVKEEKDKVELKPTPISSTPLPTPVQTSPGSLHGLFRLPASSPPSLSPDSSRVCGSFTSMTPTRIQRPTPIHATSPPFAHAQSPVTMYSSADIHASLQAFMHAQSPILSPPAALSLQRCRSPLPVQAESPAAPPSPMTLARGSFCSPPHPQSPATLAHSPVRAQTPKNDHHDSGASSGYGSPGLEASPRFHAFEHIHRPVQEDGEEEDAGVSKSTSLYHHAHVEGAGEQADDEMEVDQEYVPKKLRVSKKYKDMMGSCSDAL